MVASCNPVNADEQKKQTIINLVDNSGIKYSEVTLSDAEKIANESGKINNLYESGDFQIFYVTAYDGYNGDVEMIVLLEKGIVKALSGINIKESKDYGAKAFNDSYLSQFIGMDLSKIQTIKYGGTPSDDVDIVVVTHATMTSRAIIDTIEIICTYSKHSFFKFI